MPSINDLAPTPTSPSPVPVTAGPPPSSELPIPNPTSLPPIGGGGRSIDVFGGGVTSSGASLPALAIAGGAPTLSQIQQQNANTLATLVFYNPGTSVESYIQQYNLSEATILAAKTKFAQIKEERSHKESPLGLIGQIIEVVGIAITSFFTFGGAAPEEELALNTGETAAAGTAGSAAASGAGQLTGDYAAAAAAASAQQVTEASALYPAAQPSLYVTESLGAGVAEFAGTTPQEVLIAGATPAGAGAELPAAQLGVTAADLSATETASELTLTQAGKSLGEGTLASRVISQLASGNLLGALNSILGALGLPGIPGGGIAPGSSLRSSAASQTVGGSAGGATYYAVAETPQTSSYSVLIVIGALALVLFLIFRKR